MMRPTNRKGFYTALSVVITLVFGMLAFNAITVNNGTSAVSNLDPVCVTQVEQWNVKHPGNLQDANVLCTTAGTPTDPTTATPDTTVTPATTTMAPATTVTTATANTVATATANTVAMKPTPSFSSTETHGAWTINATERLAENPIVMAWMDRLQDPAPEMWKTFPNVPNTDVPEFRVVDGTQVPDGMEYGTYDSPYCYTDPCDFIVGAWEYRYYSGPYNFEGFECGMVGSDQGCLLLVINVMDQSYTFRDNSFDNGFTLRGRYFNGDALEWGVWGLVSHGSANMLNMPTMAHPDEVLNSGDPGNSGANCGTPQGCNSVNVRVLVYAGDALISVLETTVTK